MPTPINDATAAFGQRVREARAGAGFSQEAFAAACGLDRSYAGKVERGERNPTLLTILRIAGTLGVEPGTLLDGLDPSARPT